MTTSAHAVEIGAHLPSQDMVTSAETLKQAIIKSTSNNVTELNLRTETGEIEPLVLEPGLAKILIEMLTHFSKGEGVTFVPIQKRMTTQQAADILNVSRPYFVKLLDAGELPYEKIGRHRRVLAKDLFAFKRSRDAIRSDALAELFKDDGELY